jgi:plasmid stability protein
MRFTMIIERALVDEFRPIAERHDRSVSAELRAMMREAVDRELERQIRERRRAA